MLKKEVHTFATEGCAECVGAGEEGGGSDTLEHTVEPSLRRGLNSYKQQLPCRLACCTLTHDFTLTPFYFVTQI